jgi:hypothetical protein
MIDWKLIETLSEEYKDGRPVLLKGGSYSCDWDSTWRDMYRSDDSWMKDCLKSFPNRAPPKFEGHPKDEEDGNDDRAFTPAVARWREHDDSGFWLISSHDSGCITSTYRNATHWAELELEKI